VDKDKNESRGVNFRVVDGKERHVHHGLGQGKKAGAYIITLAGQKMSLHSFKARGDCGQKWPCYRRAGEIISRQCLSDANR